MVVQHTFPHLYSYDSNYKNIGFLDTEANDFRLSGWQYHMNMMDEIWVPCQQNLDAARNSGVTVPIKIVEHSINVSDYKPVDGAKIKEMQDSFTFGFVGEWIERKNVKAFIQAFHIAFGPREPVNMFIKTSKSSLEVVQKFCTHIRDGMKIRKEYKEEIVVSGFLEKPDYISVMEQIDCFVMPSRGEAFCIPALEAMALGIPCLYTDGIGMDYCVGESIKSRKEPCFGALQTLPDLDTSYSTWSEIDVLELAKTMRRWYNILQKNKNLKSSIKKQCIETAAGYDYKYIGIGIKEILNGG